MLLWNLVNVCVCVYAQASKLSSHILCETLLTNMTNDVADNDAAYCSIGKKVEQFLISRRGIFTFRQALKSYPASLDFFPGLGSKLDL